MTLIDRITALTNAIGAKIKDLYIRSVPAGGTTGQVLTKSSSTDYATAWTTPSATGPAINDTTASNTSVYSSNKTNSQISAAVSNLVNAAPATLDTLKELSDALGGDAAFATTVTTALGNRVRVDAAQSLTTPQQTQGRANIAAYGLAEIGNPDTDFVSIFNTAIA